MKKPTDWKARFAKTKPPKTVVTHTDFAGIKAGTTMLIGTPAMIASYMHKVPKGETRTIERMRNELARQNNAQAMCPVSTAIFARIAAESALVDLREGKTTSETIPFWRVIGPESKIGARLSCAPDEIAFWLGLESNASTV